MQRGVSCCRNRYASVSISRPGSRLEIDVEPDGIRLRPSTPAPSLTDEDGLLVHEGEPTGDLLHAVEEARALRDEQVNSALG